MEIACRTVFLWLVYFFEFAAWVDAHFHFSDLFDMWLTQVDIKEAIEVKTAWQPNNVSNLFSTVYSIPTMNTMYKINYNIIVY
jgi:hypothetical protein